MALQDEVNQRAAALEEQIAAEHEQSAAAWTAVKAEIQALKDQIAAGQTVDFAQLDAAISKVPQIYEPDQAPPV